MTQSTFLYPQVSSLPDRNGISQTDKQSRRQEGTPGEFDQIFDRTMENLNESKDLSQIRSPLKFSAHATQRLKDRKISLDATLMGKINDAVNKAEAKGIEDTLVLTSDAALIVNTKNRTVITAIDRSSAAGNVFSNIDGAVII